MRPKLTVVLIGLVLALPCSAYAVRVSLSVDAPIPAEALERALALRGVTVVAQPEAALWHVRLSHSADDSGGALLLDLRHRHGSSRSVRILPSSDLAGELLVRNLALIVAESTSPSSTPSADVPAPSPAAAAPMPTVDAIPAPTAATLVSTSEPPSRPTPWRVGATTEGGFLDLPALRIGAMLLGGYQAGRWSFDLGAGGFVGVNGGARTASSGGTAAAYARAVLPGSGFVGRLALGFDLWRRPGLTLAFGCAAEAELSKPIVLVDNAAPLTETAAAANILPWLEARMGTGRLRPIVRVGWRQPLVPAHVAFRVDSDASGPVNLYGEADFSVRGTLVVAVGALFGGR
ncbi:MAG: hypothetical protein IPL40_15690 [Proteobacteria bacterium]|nr:hypothetical protein [Pseudomonadota bacterium]